MGVKQKMPDEGSDGKVKSIIVCIIFLIIIIALAGYFLWQGFFINENDSGFSLLNKVTNKAKGIVTTTEVEAGSFAEYKEVPVAITPSLDDYVITSDLSNITNTDQFPSLLEYSENKDTHIQKLVDNNFVVTPGYNQEFFSLYESNRYQYVPNFITTDSILHNYHLYFNYLLTKLETDYLYDELRDINNKMLAQGYKMLPLGYSSDLSFGNSLFLIKDREVQLYY